jgi:hypothetical protein
MKARLTGGGRGHRGRRSVKNVVDAATQSGNRDDDDTRDQGYQQTVFHRGRTRLIFEKILDPFHFVLSFFLWYWFFHVVLGFPG